MQEKKLVEMDNYNTIFINGEGDCYYLTPFEAPDQTNVQEGIVIGKEYVDEGRVFSNKYQLENRVRQLQNRLTDIRAQLGDTDFEYPISRENLDAEQERLVTYYDRINDELVDAEKKIPFKCYNSLAQFHDRIDEQHSVHVSFLSCYVLLIKSLDRDCYWLLHYDPNQSRDEYNYYSYHDQEDHYGGKYPRPNFCDMDPKIPYSIEEANLSKNEKIDVILLTTKQSYQIDNPKPREGEFDSEAFYRRIGKDRVNSLQVINVGKIDQNKNNEQDNSQLNPSLQERGSNNRSSLGFFDDRGYSYAYHINFFPHQDRVLIWTGDSYQQEKMEHNKVIFEEDDCFHNQVGLGFGAST